MTQPGPLIIGMLFCWWGVGAVVIEPGSGIYITVGTAAAIVGFGFHNSIKLGRLLQKIETMAKSTEKIPELESETSDIKRRLHHVERQIQNLQS